MRVRIGGEKGRIRSEKVRRRKNAEIRRQEFWKNEYPFEETFGRRSERTGRLLEPLGLRAGFLYFCRFISRSPPGLYRWRPPGLFGAMPNSDPAGYGVTMRLAAACLSGFMTRRQLAEAAGYDLRVPASKNCFSYQLARAERWGWIIREPGGVTTGRGRAKKSPRLTTGAQIKRYLRIVAR